MEVARIAVAGALRMLIDKVPVITERFYWAGTAAVSYEETEHWVSMDIDLHSRELLADIEPVARRILAIPGVEKARAPDFKAGMVFARIRTDSGEITLDVFTSYESPGRLVRSHLVPGILRQSLSSHLSNKVQCLEERGQLKDWLHLALLSGQRHELDQAIMHQIARRCDPLILAERMADIERQNPVVEIPGVTASEVVQLRQFCERVRRVILSDRTVRRLRGEE